MNEYEVNVHQNDKGSRVGYCNVNTGGGIN